MLPAATGRTADAPGDLRKLYVWGYVNHVRSSRKLEAELRAQPGAALAALRVAARLQADRRFSPRQRGGAKARP